MVFCGIEKVMLGNPNRMFRKSNLISERSASCNVQFNVQRGENRRREAGRRQDARDTRGFSERERAGLFWICIFEIAMPSR